MPIPRRHRYTEGVVRMRTKLVAALAVVALVMTVGVVQAAKPSLRQSTCWMTPSPMVAGEHAHLFATGLPTKVALNVFVDDGDETYGFPVGIASDGTLEWIRYTPEYAGTIHVRVTGPERGQAKVYASCSGEVAAS
jgi:hypothetical protein